MRDAAAAIAALLGAEAPQFAQLIYNLAAGFEWSTADWCGWLAWQPGFAGADWSVVGEGGRANVDPCADHDRAAMDITALWRDTGFEPVHDLPRAGADFLAWLWHIEEPALA
ncbi:MAG: hypothetical protein QM586_09820 [Xenophilus sp.]